MAIRFDHTVCLHHVYLLNIRITKSSVLTTVKRHASLIVVGTLGIFNYTLKNMSLQLGFYCVILIKTKYKLKEDKLYE